MHALAAAREESRPDTRRIGLTGRNLPRFRIYASDQAHSSVEKGRNRARNRRRKCATRADVIPNFGWTCPRCAKQLRATAQQHFQPLAVVATVGTTSTASVDPVPEIAKVCREQKMWLHIDGAYGAGLALLPECKWVTEGWSEADSIVVNPHKMLFVPLDFSALYLRDIGGLRRLFALVPEYLHLRDPVGAEINYMDYGVQLGRRFRALKAWVVWRSFGREGMAATIREHLRLAKLFAEWIKNDKRFELAAPVVMPVVCFRFVGRDGPPERQSGSDRPRTSQRDVPAIAKADVNSEIVARINSSGRVYITQTKLRGRTVMRIGLGNVLTTEEHLRTAWELIQSEVDRVVPKAIAK